jgi:anti-sigma-K factor RskA
MVHEDYKEMIPARALSALDAAEERVLNEHLDNCSECRKELEEWQATAAALAVVTDPVEPSPEVRERILGAVRKDLSGSNVVPLRSTSRNVWSSFGSLGAIAAVVLFVALLVGLFVLWQQNRAYREEIARNNEFIQLVNTPGARVSELKGIDLGAGATAKLAHDATGHAILMASKLPNVPAGKAYQLWFIVPNKPPMPGKTFVPDSTGTAVLKDELAGDAVNAKVFAITVEPASGVSLPTGPIYLRSLEVN